MNRVALKRDIDYLVEKRNDAIEHFSDKLKCYGPYSEEEIRKSLEPVLRMCKQVKLAEDAMMLYRVIKHKKNNE